MNGPITKFEINRIRLGLIKREIFRQHDSYNEFRSEVFPDVRLNAFRQWFKKPYYISDGRLCAMEQALGITTGQLQARLEEAFGLSSQALQAVKGIQLQPAQSQIS
ncbi:hypothetical protein NC796_02175 [Aliifodinibius sp. S!AR15-10]|uniref:hypothetical protein n=1 Tax=Aliifodinibius sp. S!AR15-10 TaxID=2950437 RepID=UPI0028638ACB|nr:hypothetical protein [Aliifodinibius sp. S!AR15-10]MDR8389927.1 hypothetical protein [Aliifodinibius sp. S!AR15-10]